MYFEEKEKERFFKGFERKKDNDCWIWVKAKDYDGYGQTYLNKTQLRAHRVSWMIFKGEIPEKMHVLHKCDNPSCVNPNHLFLGTNSDNVRDRDSKRGRGRSR